jgi:hypothetical protein
MNAHEDAVSAEDVLSRLAAILRTVPAEPIRRHVMDVKGVPAEGSPYDCELRELGDAGDLARHASELAYLWLIDAAAQCMDALDSVLSAASARRHGPRPLLRAVVEHAAHASWLMQAGITVRQRGARARVADAVSADHLLRAATTAGDSPAIADATSRVERVRAQIAQLFGDDALRTDRQGRTSTVDDERLPSFTAAVESLASRHSPQASGASFYALQSTLMHPTPASATAFAKRQPDGRIVFPDFDPQYLFHTVRSAVWAWRAAVGEYLDYHGWRSPELDAWWSHAEQVLGLER